MWHVILVQIGGLCYLLLWFGIFLHWNLVLQRGVRVLEYLFDLEFEIALRFLSSTHLALIQSGPLRQLIAPKPLKRFTKSFLDL